MILTIPKFKQQQWEFLSVMAAFDTPVPVDVIAKLVDLPYSQFLELIQQCDLLSLVCHEDNGLVALSNDIPYEIKLEIDKINSSKFIMKVLDKLESYGLIDQVSPRAFKKISQKANNKGAILKEEIFLAIKALQNGEKNVAKKHLIQIENLLSSIKFEKKEDDWFLSEGIKLSEYAIVKSVGLSVVILVLRRVISMAHAMGYERYWAIANLLLGRTYWLRNNLHKAIIHFEKGKAKVEELGDSDISSYAALFIGVYYYIKGHLNKAANYLKTAVQLYYTNEGDVLVYEAPILLSYCDINRGDFHRAVGQLDFSRQCAIKRQDYYTASLYRAMLGITLWIIGKKEEAVFHLEGSQSDSLAADNVIGLWIGLFGLSSLYFSDGDVEKGGPLFKETLKIAEKAELFHQVFHPIYLESYFNAEQAGCNMPVSWKFNDLYVRIMDEPNDDLKGVAMRLMAVKSLDEGKDEKEILKYLLDSEKLLLKCEDSFQLAKTWIEMVRYYLRNNNYEKAQGLAHDLFIEMKGYCETFFPDELEFLLDRKNTGISSGIDHEASFEPILRILEEMFSSPDDAAKMELCLSTLSRYFRAERSGIFVFSKAKKIVFPELLVARNLSRSIIGDQHFRRSMDLIVSCYKKKVPFISENLRERNALIGKGYLTAMCLPLNIENEIIGILYFDNSYLPNCFDFIDVKALGLLSHRLSGIVESHLAEMINPVQKQKTVKKKDDNAFVIPTGCSDIIANDHEMLKLLKQAGRLAQSDAPILLLGETGVGKEVTAQWVHFSSLRKDKPFVVVDLTTIPEDLIESELFGHEKGAFTGADSLKVGRVELSEGGTLFFDEIGEIPLHLQSKLLRLLENKTFTRVGGTKTRKADFRIVAATNRDLFNEVKLGKFREDLYYRLNALELIIPPLRKRRQDVIALAQHFVVKFSKKYNKKFPDLNEQQKETLKMYNWPGNVRELENVIERTVIVSEDNHLELAFNTRQKSFSDDSVFSDFPTLEEVQRRYIQFVLNHTGGKIGGVGGAAEILDMKRTSVNSRMKKLGMCD